MIGEMRPRKRALIIGGSLGGLLGPVLHPPARPAK